MTDTTKTPRDVLLSVDASSAIDILDHAKATGGWPMDLFRYMLETRNADAVMFSDQIMFELVGTLPHRLEAVGQALRDAPDDATFEAILKAEVANSSRLPAHAGMKRDREDRNADLLAFMALNAGTLENTDIGIRFSHRSAAELDMAAGRVNAHSNDYRLSLEDAMQLTPAHVNEDELRLTAVAAQQLGWYSADVLKTKLNHGEHYLSPSDVARERNLNGRDSYVRDVVNATDSAPYATLGSLLSHGVVQQGEVDEVARSWKLTMGDVFGCRLLPRDALPEVGRALGFTVNDPILTLENIKTQGLQFETLEKRMKEMKMGLLPARFEGDTDDERKAAFLEALKTEGVPLSELATLNVVKRRMVWDMVKDELADQGFFEKHLTIGDARTISGLDEGRFPPRFPAMQTLASPKAVAFERGHDFDDLARKDMPYERVFTDALINGAMTTNEFLQIAVAGGALAVYDNTLTTRDNAVRIEYDPDEPELSSVRVLKKGVSARTLQSAVIGRDGRPTHPDLVENITTRPLPMAIEDAKGFTVPLDVLIEKAGEARAARSGNEMRYDAVLDATLLDGVRSSAFNVREKAIETLGEDRVHQMETDFAAKHFRHRVKSRGLRPSHDSLTTVHASMRADQWDLGELAVLDAALDRQQLTDKTTTVYLIHNDHELRDATEKRVVPLELAQKKVDYKAEINGLNRELGEVKDPCHNTHTDDFYLAVAVALKLDTRMQEPAAREEVLDRYPVLEKVLADTRLMDRAEKLIANKELDKDAADLPWVKRVARHMEGGLER